MTTNYIAKLRELREKATRRPWFFEYIGPEICRIATKDENLFEAIEDSFKPEQPRIDSELTVLMRNSLDLWLELADALDQFFTKSYIPTHREDVMLVNNYNQRALPQVEKAFLKLRGEG